MSLRVCFAVLAVCLPNSAAAQRSAVDAGALTAVIGTRVQAFQTQWDAAWRTSEGERHPTYSARTRSVGNRPGWIGSGEGSRYYAYHCDGHAREIGRGYLFHSRVTKFGVCPGWLRDELTGPVGDERLALDFGLVPRLRAEIKHARDTLIRFLDSLAAAHPASDLLAGQRVRFLVDQWDYARALDAARACGGTPAWCARLVGYASAAAGQLTAADAAFRSALALDTSESRCIWNDHRAILDSIARPAYAALTCAQRDSANAWLWILAAPLWTEPTNARFVEQSVRQVLITLRAAFGRDERYSWDDRLGNDARREMVLRYGWPTYVFWPGDEVEKGHSGHLRDWWQSPPNPPYTTYEYAPGRQRLIPLGRAVLDPFSATSADFDLVPPPGGDGPSIRQPLWWPNEHYAPPAPLRQFEPGQVAIFRRDTAALLATALRADNATLALPDDAFAEIHLLAVATPPLVQRVAAASVRAGSTVALRGTIAAAPQLIGLEVPASAPAIPTARTRFGISAPPPLTALAPGTIAVSDPAILAVSADVTELPNSPDDALRTLAPSTSLPHGARIGVYWETYGVAPTDSLELAVWITRARDGFFRRLAGTLRIVEDRNTPVAVSWSEAHAGRQAAIIPSATAPILGRSLLLDLAGLSPGNYTLEVAVQRPGNEAVRGRRELVVR